MHERSIRIPIRLIDRQYGRDNVDNAGDDVANLLIELSDYPEQYRYAFDIESGNASPYFHALVFIVFDVRDSVFDVLGQRIADLGLAE